MHKHPGTGSANRRQARELRNQGVLALRQFRLAHHLDRADLILDQLQPRDFALELIAQRLPKLFAVFVPPRCPVAAANDDARSQVVQY